MQHGDRAFNTAPLTLEQWMWCILFGVGVLVWGQLITTIPTKRIPKRFTWGSGPPDEMMDATSSLVEDGSSGSLSQDVKRTGQILWIRGLTRLQTQVCLIQLHNSTVSQQLSLKRQSLGSPTSPTALAAAAVAAGSSSSARAAAGHILGHSHSIDLSGPQTSPLVIDPSSTLHGHLHKQSTLTGVPYPRPDTITETPELPGEVASSDSPLYTPPLMTNHELINTAIDTHHPLENTLNASDQTGASVSPSATPTTTNAIDSGDSNHQQQDRPGEPNGDELDMR